MSGWWERLALWGADRRRLVDLVNSLRADLADARNQAAEANAQAAKLLQQPYETSANGDSGVQV